MYSIMPFDEINRSMPFDEYFSGMGLSREEKAERIDLARDIESVVLYFFDAVIMYLNDSVGSPTALLSLLIAELMEAFDEKEVTEKQEPDDTLPDILAALFIPGFSDKYAVQLAQELFTVTMKNKDKPYFLSKDRARFIAEEESNTIFSRIGFIKAVARGKKKKTWMTQRDPKVRETHKHVDGVTIGIDEYFTVGSTQMLFPRDVVNAGSFPDEIVNCRCFLVYS